MHQPQSNWSNLPTDILIIILHLLIATTTNIHRLRGVCASWRTSLVPPNNLLTFPLQIHLPPLHPYSPHINPDIIKTGNLSQSAFYLISPNKTAHPSTSTETLNPWLIRVEEPNWIPLNNWTLQNPMSILTRFKPMPNITKAKISFLDHNVIELARSYNLFPGRLGDEGIKVRKIIMFPKIGANKTDGFSLLALFGNGELGLWKSTTHKWTIIRAPQSRFSDAIVYENEFYVTDTKGRLTAINPSTFELRDIIVTDVQTCVGMFTYLVESSGKLYLANKEVNDDTGYRTLYGPLPGTKRMGQHRVQCRLMQPMGIGIWVLSHGEIGPCWNLIWSLDGRVFFVTDYVTFSISAQELGWNRGDYIFFNEDDFRGHAKQCYNTICQHYDHTYKSEMQMVSRDCGIYDVPQGAITTTSGDYLPAPFKLFWPVPSWLVRNRPGF